ncbi:MAG: restriction endonuclease subunit S [Gammaproteobacteria bacterium]|nr:restriction endonuclease subunit S [Gammaproteobacteria bacterium]
MSTRELTLDQLGAVSRGRSRHRPRNAAQLYGGPYPFVQTGDVKRAGLYLRDYEQTYSEKGLAQSKLWPVGTLCITIAANIAETSILDIEACFPDSVIGFTANQEVADTRFVKYLFDAALKMRYRSFTQGAAQDNLSQAKLLSITFPVPERSVQQKIADVLSAYDNLIENNRQRIALLEEAARLLYREWFVELRFPGYQHIKVVDGVPEGWCRGKLGDVVETNAESYRAEGLPEEINYIDISSVERGRIVSRKRLSAGRAPSRARRKVSDGNIIWSNVRPNLRAYALVLEPDEVDVVSTGFTVLAAKSVPFTWLYEFVTTDFFVGHLVNNATGAGYPAVRPGDFERVSLSIAPDWLLTRFHEVVEPMFRMIAKLDRQNRGLAQARDLLLPRLMNGEIAV